MLQIAATTYQAALHAILVGPLFSNTGAEHSATTVQRRAIKNQRLKVLDGTRGAAALQIANTTYLDDTAGAQHRECRPPLQQGTWWEEQRPHRCER